MAAKASGLAVGARKGGAACLETPKRQIEANALVDGAEGDDAVDDDSDIEIDIDATPTSAGIAGLAITVGICLATHAYVPVYGAAADRARSVHRGVQRGGAVEAVVSELKVFRVSPGETVHVETPAQRRRRDRLELMRRVIVACSWLVLLACAVTIVLGSIEIAQGRHVGWNVAAVIAMGPCAGLNALRIRRLGRERRRS